MKVLILACIAVGAMGASSAFAAGCGMSANESAQTDVPKDTATAGMCGGATSAQATPMSPDKPAASGCSCCQKMAMSMPAEPKSDMPGMDMPK